MRSFASSELPSQLNDFPTIKIRDPIHNTIYLLEDEKNIIDTYDFQRLRRIHQTAFIQYAFPGATHTRFSHSLGAMHTVTQMITRILRNQKELLRKSKLLEIQQTAAAVDQIQKDPYFIKCLRLAALLHDVGHSPLSHSGEIFLPSVDDIKSTLQSKEIFESLNTQYLHKATHELYSLYTVGELIEDKDLARDTASLLSSYISCKPKGLLDSSHLSGLLRSLISGHIDCDRMDYLQRDSYYCGVIYGYFDMGRLLDCLCFYWDEKTNQYALAVKSQGVPALEDFIHARWSMYRQVYFHKNSSACEAALKYFYTHHENIKLPLPGKEYLAVDDYNFYEYLQSKTSDPKFKELLIDIFHRRVLWKKTQDEGTEYSHTINNLSDLTDKIKVLHNHKLENIKDHSPTIRQMDEKLKVEYKFNFSS